MDFSKKKRQIKQWRKLANRSSNSLDKLTNLRIKLATITDTIFPTRVQPAKGFFNPKPTDYIVPTNWGVTDPCVVTIYRNAIEDSIWEDGVVNIGTDEDVKDFQCPHFREKHPCHQKCKYRQQNNNYFKLPSGIENATARFEKLRTRRKAAWANLITHSGK